MIKSKAWSDCGQKLVQFDATAWAEQASDEAISALIDCGFSRDYPADDVAMFMAEVSSDVATLFEFIEIVRRQPFSGDTNGFECAVDEADMLAFIATHRPHLLPPIREELTRWG